VRVEPVATMQYHSSSSAQLIATLALFVNRRRSPPEYEIAIHANQEFP